MYIGHPEAFDDYFVKNFALNPNKQFEGLSKEEIAQIKEIAIKFFCLFSISDHRKLPEDWIDVLWPLGDFFTKDSKKVLKSKKTILAKIKESGGVEFRPKKKYQLKVYNFLKDF